MDSFWKYSQPGPEFQGVRESLTAILPVSVNITLESYFIFFLSLKPVSDPSENPVVLFSTQPSSLFMFPYFRCQDPGPSFHHITPGHVQELPYWSSAFTFVSQLMILTIAIDP